MADRRVLDDIARERLEALTGFAYLVCGSLVDAERLTHRAAVRVLSGSGSGGDAQRAESRIKGAIVADCMAAARTRAARESLRNLDESPIEARSPEPWLGGFAAIDAALSNLTIPQRACLVLVHVEEMSVPEVAWLLRLSDTTVARYVNIAVERLQAGGPGREPIEIGDLLRSAAP